MVEIPVQRLFTLFSLAAICIYVCFTCYVSYKIGYHACMEENTAGVLGMVKELQATE